MLIQSRMNGVEYLPQTQARNTTTFRPPPLSNKSLTVPDLYDWQYDHSPNHPIFVYQNIDHSVKTITYSEAVPAMHRAGYYVTSKLPPEIVENARKGRSTLVATLAATGASLCLSGGCVV